MSAIKFLFIHKRDNSEKLTQLSVTQMYNTYQQQIIEQPIDVTDGLHQHAKDYALDFWGYQDGIYQAIGWANVPELSFEQNRKWNNILMELSLQDGSYVVYCPAVMMRTDLIPCFGEESQYCGFKLELSTYEGHNVSAIRILAEADGQYLASPC